MILCADHNSLVVKHRDAFAPPEFEHDTSLRAREQEVATLAQAGLYDVYVDIHCPTLTDINDKESLCPTGFTYDYPWEGERLDPQRLRHIDRIHTTSDLFSLATSVYPMFAPNSDHKAILAEFTPPSFETEGTIRRFYFPETILQDPEAMEELETSLKSITSTGDQWWEDALGCIQTRRSIIKGNTKTRSSRWNYRLYGSYTCRKSLCFLCPNPYPFSTGFRENTRVYAPGFGTIAAKLPRIKTRPEKKRSG